MVYAWITGEIGSKPGDIVVTKRPFHQRDDKYLSQ